MSAIRNCPNCGACAWQGPRCSYCGSKPEEPDHDQWARDMQTIVDAYFKGLVTLEQVREYVDVLIHGQVTYYDGQRIEHDIVFVNSQNPKGPSGVLCRQTQKT